PHAPPLRHVRESVTGEHDCGITRRLRRRRGDERNGEVLEHQVENGSELHDVQELRHGVGYGPAHRDLEHEGAVDRVAHTAQGEGKAVGANSQWQRSPRTLRRIRSLGLIGYTLGKADCTSNGLKSVSIKSISPFVLAVTGPSR